MHKELSESTFLGGKLIQGRSRIFFEISPITFQTFLLEKLRDDIFFIYISSFHTVFSTIFQKTFDFIKIYI